MGNRTLLVHWEGKNLKLLTVFKSTGKNKIKLNEKREFLLKISL